MKKLVFVLVLSLAVAANAEVTGAISSFGVQAAAPSTGGGYINNIVGTGNETRTVIWANGPADTGGWGDTGIRDVGQNFTLATGQQLGGFAFSFGPYVDGDALYLGADSEFKVSLYALAGSGDDALYNYQSAGNTMVASWTGMMPASLSGTVTDNWSWLVMNFDTAYTLNAGQTYGIEIGWTSNSGDKWGHLLRYGIWGGPEAGSGAWAVFTAANDDGSGLSYNKTWRTGNFALITPEPATLALLGLGGLLLRRRSK
jgi:hypothetical protein